MGDRSNSPLDDFRYVKACPAGCAAVLERTDILVAEGPLLKCRECGQLVSQMTEEAYARSIAALDVPEGTLPQSRLHGSPPRMHKKRLKKISRLAGLAPQRSRLLDVGCSSGAFLASARSLGYVGTGVEPAAKPVKTAKEFGLDVRQGFLQDLRFPDETFDAITLFEVIEHVREPMTLLRECRRILKREGVMVIGTGNADSWTVRFMKGNWDYFMNHGGHVSFYNLMSLSKLAGRAGFRVIRKETRGCSLYRKDQVSEFRYAISKIVRELLSVPAKLFDKGHDMVVFLGKA